MPRLLRDNTPEEMQMHRRFVTRLRVIEGSDLVGKHFDEVIARLPDDFRFEERPIGQFQVGQRLKVSGTHEALEEALRQLGGQVAPGWVIDRIRRNSADTGEDVQVVEMVVTADSRLIGRTLATSGIADHYNVAVLGVHKPERILGHEYPGSGPDVRFAEGDVLLVTGLSAQLQEFAANDSLLPLEGAKEVPRRSKALLAAAIMLFVTLLTNFASNATAATVGTPIAFAIANQLDLPPEPLVLAVLFGCNLCYATPVAYQTNMLIMAEGDYRFGDYIRTGVPLVILMTITLSALLVWTYGLT